MGENNGGKSNAIDAIRLLISPLSGRRQIYATENDPNFDSSSRTFRIEAEFAGLSLGQQGRLITASPDATLNKAVFGISFDATEGSGGMTDWAGQEGQQAEAGAKDMIRHVYLPPLRDAKKDLASGNPTRILALLRHFLGESSEEEFVAQFARKGGETPLTDADHTVDLGLSELTDGVRPQRSALRFAARETLYDIARDLRFHLADENVEPEDLTYSGHGYSNLLYLATIIVELENARDVDLTIFLVEEPEAHLHPQLQAAVLSFLQNRARNSRTSSESLGPAGEIQVIVTTHSPHLSAWVPSKNIVIFKSQHRVPNDQSQGQTISRNSASDQANPADGVQATPPVRAVTGCIPLSKLDLSPEERRKVDRYVDVTKAAFLFGGRVLLVEGISEALLLPLFAEDFVLKDQPNRLRVFKSAVFVPIDGIDFAPYVKLLLQPFEGIRIAEKLVIVTDGDQLNKGNLDTNEEVPAGQPENPGLVRKQNLESIARKFGAAANIEVCTNRKSLEIELIDAGNESLLKEVYLSLHPRSRTKWESAVRAHCCGSTHKLYTLFKNVRKGDFAQALAERIRERGKEIFVVPKYLSRAIIGISE